MTGEVCNHGQLQRQCPHCEANNEIERQRDALDHIMRVCAQSRKQSRRIRWIKERARCALDGTDDWQQIDLPKSVDSDSKRLQRLKAQIGETG